MSFAQEIGVQFRVRCSADWPGGCLRLGPKADSRREAAQKALEAGWKTTQKKWACPLHLRSLKRGVS